MKDFEMLKKGTTRLVEFETVPLKVGESAENKQLLIAALDEVVQLLSYAFPTTAFCVLNSRVRAISTAFPTLNKIKTEKKRVREREFSLN